MFNIQQKAYIIIIILFAFNTSLQAWSVGEEELEIPKVLEENSLEPLKIKERKHNVLDGSVFEKRASKLSSEEQAIANYSQALELINMGKTFEAEETLQKNLIKYPHHNPTRAELARLFLKENRDLDAQLLLEQGLKQAENHPDFLNLIAMIYERRGDIETALRYLSKLPEESKNDKNTVIFLGHIYQKAGHFAQARQQYQRLLEIEPMNPLWALGLSIAYDSEGKKEKALEGYKRLQSETFLDPHVLNYIKERISILKGS